MNKMGEVLDLLGIKEGIEYEAKETISGDIINRDYIRKDSRIIYRYLGRYLNKQETGLYEELIKGEYILIPIKRITDDEKVILRNVPKKYKWITRDGSRNLYCFSEKPRKVNFEWWCETCSTSYFKSLYIFDHLFQSIQWKDDEPCLISDLLDS